MRLFYVTADEPGARTGGGRVTQEELRALSSLGEVTLIRPRCGPQDPFAQDVDVCRQLDEILGDGPCEGLAHLYAGPFSATVRALKWHGLRVTYTVAAHDIERSKKAHRDLGVPFDYPHLNRSDLFYRYVRGYVQHADVVIVPGQAPLRVVRSQGRVGPVVVIPHGCDHPKEVPPFRPQPGRLKVGYLGAAGPDKGLLTLAKAWGRVNRAAGPTWHLYLGGSQSHDAKRHLFFAYPNVTALGWVEDVSDFYRAIDVYVQPSETEGYGIEVAEAHAHGRVVICSREAGACDDVSPMLAFEAGDDGELYQRLMMVQHWLYTIGPDGGFVDADARSDASRSFVGRAAHLSWDLIRGRYVELWRELLSGGGRWEN